MLYEEDHVWLTELTMSHDQEEVMLEDVWCLHVTGASERAIRFHGGAHRYSTICWKGATRADKGDIRKSSTGAHALRKVSSSTFSSVEYALTT